MTENQWERTLAVQRLAMLLDVPEALIQHIHGTGQSADDVPVWVEITAETYVHTKREEIAQALGRQGLVAFPNGGNLVLPTRAIAPEMFVATRAGDPDAIRYLYDARLAGRDVVFHAATPDKVLLCTGEPVDNDRAWQDWTLPLGEDAEPAGKLAWFLGLVSGAGCHKCKYHLRHSRDVAVIWQPQGQRHAARDLHREMVSALAAASMPAYHTLGDQERIIIAGITLDNVVRGGDSNDLVMALEMYQRGKAWGGRKK